MPRKPRFAPPGYPLDLTQHGNYRQPVFFSDEDRTQFLTHLDHHADLRQVLVHGYALMSNHIHLVVTGQVEDGVSRFMQHPTGQYAQYLHGRLNRRGRLWQSLLLLRPRWPALSRRPRLRRPQPRPRPHRHPSHGLFLVIRRRPRRPQYPPPPWLDLETPHRQISPGEWRGRLGQPQDGTAIAALRRATRTEIPLGEPSFDEALEAKFQIRLQPQPLGRPNKKPAQKNRCHSRYMRATFFNNACYCSGFVVCGHQKCVSDWVHVKSP